MLGILEMSLIKPNKILLFKNLFVNTLNHNNVKMLNSLFRCITFKTIIFEPFCTSLKKGFIVLLKNIKL